MSTNRIEKSCPYCGQQIICEEGIQPEMVCTCTMALVVQDHERNTKKLLQELEDLYGEKCREKYPEFSPVSEEQYAVMAQMVDMVGHDRMGNVSFQLPDGSKCKITTKEIVRSKTIVRRWLCGNG
jgi:hypothetical protein